MDREASIIFKVAGLVLAVFGAGFLMMFYENGLGVMIVIPIMALVIGTCMLLVGVLNIRRTKFTPCLLCLVISESIFIGVVIMLAVVEYSAKYVIPSESLSMFHGAEAMCVLGAALTFVTYKILVKE